MKLRNKKTGEIIITHKIIQNAFDEIVMLTLSEDDIYPYKYHSLAELNEEWEDYTPKEPLIKDEKIRKAVRAWAEACGIDEHGQKINYDGDWTFWCMVKDCSIDFTDVYAKNEDSLITCNNDVYFTIAELCGEEEE